VTQAGLAFWPRRRRRLHRSCGLLVVDAVIATHGVDAARDGGGLDDSQSLSWALEGNWFDVLQRLVHAVVYREHPHKAGNLEDFVDSFVVVDQRQLSIV
jgi:hypothetical protein